MTVLVPRGAEDPPWDASPDTSEDIQPTAPVAVAPASLEEDIRAFGDDTDFFAASTAKILPAVASYHLVETGEADLDEPLGDDDAGFQLEAMVNNSSNDAWLLLMDRIGYGELSAYAGSIGITYDPGRNLLAPAEMTSVLTRLSAGELHDAALLTFRGTTIALVVHTGDRTGQVRDVEDALFPAGSSSMVSRILPVCSPESK